MKQNDLDDLGPIFKKFDQDRIPSETTMAR